MKKIIFTLILAFTLGSASYTVANAIHSSNAISKVLNEKDKDKKKKDCKKADKTCCSKKETKACSSEKAAANQEATENANTSGVAVAPAKKSCCKGAGETKTCSEKKK